MYAKAGHEATPRGLRCDCCALSSAPGALVVFSVAREDVLLSHVALRGMRGSVTSEVSPSTACVF